MTHESAVLLAADQQQYLFCQRADTLEEQKPI